MIETLTRVPGYILMRKNGKPKLLPLNLTVSVTYKCNSKCKTCNIWDKKSVKELSSDEFRMVFNSIGSTPYWVTLSGGEPFLRGDLTEIVGAVCEELDPSIVNIPTNGLVKNTPQIVEKIIKENPKTRFIINLSLDGVGVKHDEIRGVPGAFEKAVNTFHGLSSLTRGNLDLGIHTVVSKYNASEIGELIAFSEQLKPSSYITEIAERRVELCNRESDITPSIQEYEKAANLLKAKLKNSKAQGIPKVIKTLRNEYYDLTLKTLEQQTQVIPCFAGVCSAQITPDGYVWPCCVRADELGNLRDVDFDFKKIWFSGKAREVRRSIKNKECYCPLANAAYTNMLCSPKTLIKIFFKVIS